MPSVYAHYRFGRDMIEQLPDTVRNQIAPYRELFDIGLQGPDLLFFYRPFYRNYVNRLGSQIHKWPGRKFFEPAARIIRNRRNRAAFTAYICGMVCHYALDLTCHSYIYRIIEEKHLNHSAIEGSFERSLIVEDHLPLNTLVTGSLKVSRRNAAVIHQFYGRTTGKQILSALRMMIWCNDALRMKESNIIKRTIFFVLRLIGKYESIAGMVIPPQPKPEFAESDAELRRRYELAKPVALRPISELLDCIEHGKRLGCGFLPTFAGAE